MKHTLPSDFSGLGHFKAVLSHQGKVIHLTRKQFDSR